MQEVINLIEVYLLSSHEYLYKYKSILGTEIYKNTLVITMYLLGKSGLLSGWGQLTLMQLFSLNRPSGQITSTIRHVHVFVLVSVCVRHRETSTSRGQNKFWSKCVAFILASDE